MKIKEALGKIVYKATLMTYEQSQSSSHGECIDEGYSSDLRGSLFADCEVEHIAYDNYRKRTALTIDVKELIEVVKVAEIGVLKNFLRYRHGISNHGLTEKEIRTVVVELMKKY